MIERFLLKILLLISILASGVDSLDAQVRQDPNALRAIRDAADQAIKENRWDDYIQLAGQFGRIDCLEPWYCNNADSGELVLNADWNFTGDSIGWRIVHNDTNTDLTSILIEKVGWGASAQFYLKPEYIPSLYLSHFLRVDAFEYNAGLTFNFNNDYIRIARSPIAYHVTIDDDEICAGESTTLRMESSEADVTYYLYRGVNQIEFRNGTGGELTFNVDQSGTYRIYGELLIGTTCIQYMKDEPSLTVHLLPSPIATSDNPTYCEGDPIQLFADPDGMTSYSWEYPDGTIVTEQDPIIASAVRSLHNGTYTLTVGSPDGCSNSTTHSITVNENPTVTLPADFEICEASALTITASVTGGSGPYSFSWTRNGNPLAETTGTISIATAGLSDAGLYEVTVTDANSCGSSSASITVGVTPRPVIDVISNDGPACDGGIINLSSSASGTGTLTFSWTGPNGFTSTVQNPVIDPATLAMDGIYTLVVSDANACNSLPATTDVEINVLPTATLTGDTEVCAGSIASYSAGGGVWYTFTVRNASNTVVETSGRLATSTYDTSALPAGTYTITVLVEDANGCTDEETLPLTVYPDPAATISFDDTAICDGESSTLRIVLTTGATPWSVTFNDGSGNVVRNGISSNTHTESVSPGSDVTYTLVSLTDANGCTATPVGLTADLLVNEVPTASVTSSNPLNQVCVDGTLTLTASGSGGSGNYVYQWSRAGNPIVGATSNTLQITNAQLSDAGAYSVVVGDVDNGITCMSNPATITVVVTEASATLTGELNICEGTSETYTATGGVLYAFTLLNAADVIVDTRALDADADYTTDVTLPIGVYTLRVLVRDANGCEDEEDLAIEVRESPDNTLTLSSSDICDGETITATATAGYTSYNFMVNGTSVQSGANNVYSSNAWTDSDVIKVAITLGSCAVESAEETITVRDLPTIALSSGQTDDVACLNEEITFTASGGVDYAFEINGTEVQAFGNGNTLNISTLVDGDVVRVIGEGANGCTNSAAIEITINTPIATLIASDTELCANETLVLTASGGSLYEFFRNGSSIGAAGTDNEIEITDPADGDEFYVTVENSFGCTEVSTTIEITVFPLPVATLSSDVTEICAGDPVTFTASGGNHYSFYILRNSLDLVQQQGGSDQFVTSSLEDGDLVYVVVRNANLCNGISASIAITVNALPVAGINVLPSNNIGAGDNVTVEASGGVDYIYMINGVPYDGDPNGWTTDASLVISGLVDGDELSVIARNTFGCTDVSEVVTINVDAYPVEFVLQPAYSEYCAGEAGVQLSLSGYEGFVVYELYETSDLINPVATSTLVGGVMVWNDVPEGFYQVKATRLTGFGTISWFPTIVEVREQPAPTVFNMNPTGVVTACPVTISLDGSEIGFNYNLLLNGEFFSGPVAGDNGSLNMGSHSVGGVYTIEAVDLATGCASLMNGQLDLDVLPNSGVFNLVSDPASGIYCEGSGGVTLILEGSSNGAAYEVYRNSSSTGISDVGTGEPIQFGPFTEAGFYRVMIAAAGGCLYPMDGVVEVAMDPAPDTFTLEAANGGHFCLGDPTGVVIRQVGQQAGVVYQLYYEGVAQGAAMIGSINDPAIVYNYGTFNIPGEYTVIGTMPVSGCEGLIGSITLTGDPLPQIFEVDGDPGYCAGGVAVIELSGSQSGVTYVLYLDGVATVQSESGNGGLIQFTVNAPGSYSIVASDDNTSCEADMNGQVIVVEKPLPDQGILIDDDITGIDCDIDATITLLNSQDGVVYEIYWWVDANNNGPTGFVVTGNGNNVDFPDVDFDGNGNYKVLASLDGCEVFLDDDFEVDIPGAITKYAVLGNGAICEGDAGINIRLSSSEPEVTYVLWSLGAGVGGVDVPVRTIVTNYVGYSDGESLDFGLISEPGDYIVLATNDDCTDIPMHGTVELRFNNLPVAYQITGSGVFCDVSQGAEIGLNGSEVGVLYTLVYDGDFIPRVRDTALGSGDVLTFQSVFEEGPYTVYARNEVTGCTSSMNGEVDVTLLPAPDISGVEVDPIYSYCDSELGATVRLSTSEFGIIYRIYDALDQEVASVLGDGAGDLPFETLIPAGTYSVKAMRMGGECEVSFDTGFTVVPDPSPIVPILSNVDGLISVDNAEIGVTYTLFHAIDGEQTPNIAFTGSEDVSWLVYVSGSYFVEAAWTDNSPCTSISQSLSVNFVTSPVDPYTLSVGQDMSYCSADGAGVTVSLGGTTPDVYYELVDVNDLSTPFQIIKGNGGAVSFPNLVTGTTTYTITVQGDNSKFSFNGNNFFTITEYITPEVFTVNSGIANQSVLLSGSEEEVWYFLIRDGEYAFDQPDFGIRGTGGMLEFLSVELPGDYYVLAVAEDGGCEALMTGFVRIHQSQLKANPDTLYLDAGDLSGSIDLSALITGKTSSDVNLTYSARILNESLGGSLTVDASSGLLTYYKAPSFFGKDSVHYTVANPSVLARKSTSYIIIMAGNKDFGDVQSFLLPNAFSPNADGINDRFVISGLGLTEESSLEVFNRWGTIVYRSEGKNYDNSWDGTSNVGAMISIGKELPNGVYFYVFEVKKNVEGTVQTRRFSGYVELRR